MKKIKIGKNIVATILPEYGGMVAELKYNDIDILQMNYDLLGIRNARSGGIPILFPFAGETEGQSYYIDAKKYEMPMHGYLKDMKFKIDWKKENSCQLSVENLGILKELYYPYDFSIKIIYSIEGLNFRTVVKIYNRSKDVMSFSLGFHPYFLTSKKESVKFQFDMTECRDYTRNGEYTEVEMTPSLDKKLNHVYKGTAPQIMQLNNPNDGYDLTIETDETFNVVTLCTRFPGASCIEPWQGMPNCANTAESIQTVEANKMREFKYNIKFHSQV